MIISYTLTEVDLGYASFYKAARIRWAIDIQWMIWIANQSMGYEVLRYGSDDSWVAIQRQVVRVP